MLSLSMDNRVVIITGAASGIGLAMVPLFLEAGATGVVAVDRSGGLDDALSAAASRYGTRLVLIHGDVSTEATAKEFTETALSRFGRIDVMVNNAAESVVKPLHEHSESEWDSVMSVNVKAAYWSTRYIVPVMTRGGGGVILNSGSISGTVGLPGQGAYAASKGAIHQMTRQMAIEYAPLNIRVNAICCGTVDTPIVHRSAAASGNPEAYWKMLREGHPIGRIATPKEIAKFFVYMASDDASFFTGSLLMMDGGYTAK